MVKDARKVGRLGEGLTEWAGRSAREVVDGPMLQNAVASGSVLRPGETLTAIKAAFRAEKAGALVRLAKDVGRVGEKAGIRAAQDTLKIAEKPKDVARAARLAESKGGQTRAILKMLGRGALLLAVGAFNLTMWVFGALLALFGLLSSIKATTERLTQSWLRRKKARRLRSRRRQHACRPARLWRALPRAARLAPLQDRPFRSPKTWNYQMPSFHNGAVEIAYLDEGEGDPIVLVHGFASSKNVNWVYPTWVSELKKNGRRVIALDNRGHGDSGKLYDSAEPIDIRDHGRRRRRADGSSRNRARRHHGLFAGRADDGDGWRCDQPQRLRSAIFGGIGIGADRGRRPRRERRRKRWRRRRSTTSPIRSGGRFAPSPTRPAPTAARSPPACAARGG